MQIGKRSSRSRVPNDLDEYLEEVRDCLFCISEADKTCYLNDLKAHVRELTTDPANTSRFEGRYRITRAQLFDAMGPPETIAIRYMAEVPKEPSRWLVCFLMYMTCIFLSITMIGIERMHAGLVIGDNGQTWNLSLGAILMVSGLCFASICIIVKKRFNKQYFYMPYLVASLGFLSHPVSLWISNWMVSGRDIVNAGIQQEPLFAVITADMLVVLLLGMYIVVKHIQVIKMTEKDIRLFY